MLDWPTAPMRIQDPRTTSYITPAEPQNGSWPPSRATARRTRDLDPHRRATTSPSPYPRTSHRRDSGKAELIWCARQDALASSRLTFLVHRHFPLQRKQVIEPHQRPNILRSHGFAGFQHLGLSGCCVSQGVKLIAARLSSKASHKSLRSLGPPPSGEDARDRPNHRSIHRAC